MSTREQAKETEPINDLAVNKQSNQSHTSTKLYWFSLILGYAILEPWNSIATCMYYFEVLYKPYGYDPEFTLPMINFFPLMGCQLLIVAYGSKVSPRIKIVLSLALLSLSFFVVILFCKCISNMVLSFVLIIIMTLVIGFFNGIAQSAIGGLVGVMGCEGKYIVANMIGYGISGILSNLLEIFSLIVIGHQEENLFRSTMLFFIVVGFTMLGSVYTSYLLIEDPYVRHVTKQQHSKTLKETFKLFWPVFRGQGKNCFSLYAMTFLVFPGVLIAKPLECVPSQWSVPLMMLVFNVFDTAGRFVPNCFVLLSSKGTAYLTFLRVFSIASICFIGYGVFQDFFVSDWWLIVNNVIFALTNGLGTTLSIMHEVNEAKDADKEDVGELMTFFMTSGMFVGAVLAQFILANLF